jgi:hypothetical protein
VGLKEAYDNQEEIDEKYRDLYTQKGEKWVFSGVDGVTTSADRQRLSNENATWRNKHKEVNNQLQAFTSVLPEDLRDPEKLKEHLDTYEELKARADAAEGKIDTKKLDEMAEARARPKISKIENDLNKLKLEKEKIFQENQSLKHERNMSFLDTQLRGAGSELKVLDTVLAPIGNMPSEVMLLAERIFEVVLEDDENSPNYGRPVRVQTKDNVGVTPGISPKEWLEEMRSKRPHWWPPSSGSGSQGNSNSGPSGGPNPFDRSTWNPDAQLALMRTDMKRAEALAKAAGSVPMGAMPPPKKQ